MLPKVTLFFHFGDSNANLSRGRSKSIAQRSFCFRKKLV